MLLYARGREALFRYPLRSLAALGICVWSMCTQRLAALITAVEKVPVPFHPPGRLPQTQGG